MGDGPPGGVETEAGKDPSVPARVHTAYAVLTAVPAPGRASTMTKTGGLDDFERRYPQKRRGFPGRTRTPGLDETGFSAGDTDAGSYAGGAEEEEEERRGNYRNVRRGAHKELERHRAPGVDERLGRRLSAFGVQARGGGRGGGGSGGGGGGGGAKEQQQTQV